MRTAILTVLLTLAGLLCAPAAARQAPAPAPVTTPRPSYALSFAGNSLSPDPAKPAPARQFSVGYEADDLDVSPDGTALAYAARYSEDNSLPLLDGRTGKAVGALQHPYWGTAVAVSPGSGRNKATNAPAVAVLLGGVREGAPGLTHTGYAEGPDGTTNDGHGPSWHWDEDGDGPGKEDDFGANGPDRRRVTGIAVRGDVVLVSDATPSPAPAGHQDKGPQQVWVLSLRTPGKDPLSTVRRVPLEDPGHIAASRDGQWAWVIQPGRRRVVKLGVGVETAGQTPVTIAETDWEPSDVAVDAAGRVLVSDAGPDRQVKVFDQMTGERDAAFGTRGGIRASSVGGRLDHAGGRVAFDVPEGVAVDDAGNLFVLNNTAWPDRQARIESFAPDGKGGWLSLPRWRAWGARQGAPPAFDSARPTVLLGAGTEYDLSAPGAPPARRVYAREAPPLSTVPGASNSTMPDVTGVVYLAGRRFLVCRQSGHFALLRPDPARPAFADLAVVVGARTGAQRGGKPWSGLPWDPSSPAEWSESEELLDVARDGALWRLMPGTDPQEPRYIRFIRYPFTGLDKDLLPVWDFGAGQVYRIEHTRNSGATRTIGLAVWRVDSAGRALYVYGAARGREDAARGQDASPNNVQGAARNGWHLSRYDLPATPGGTAAAAGARSTAPPSGPPPVFAPLRWRRDMAVYTAGPGRDGAGVALFSPDDPVGNGWVGFALPAGSGAARHLFVVRNAGLRVGVIDADSGALLEELRTPFAPTIWVDRPEQIAALQPATPGGAYRIAVSDPYHNRFQLYDWKPPSAP